MYTYSFSQWLLFFYIYCFLGWIIESTIVSYTQKKLVNRGYLKGPILPIYGFGSIIVLFVTLPYRNNFFLIYFLGMISATILEYFSGWLMENTLKIKYWDYTNERFNLHGRICLSSSLFWGVLSLVLTILIHSPAEKFVLNIKNTNSIVAIISIIFIIDFIYSTYNAINLNKLFIFTTKIKAEIEEIYDKLKDSNIAPNKYDTDNLKLKLSELKTEYLTITEKFKISYERLIKSYPRAYSKIINNPIKDIKNRFISFVNEYKKDE